MDTSFDLDAFIRRIGKRLVEKFADAKAGTTPSAVGSAAEQPVRDQLEQLLPRGVGVGEGFVIDSYGGTSRQQDVVLYERDICPVFSINLTPQTTYYPCEGVIAVGEIKSRLDRESLEDSFKKVASVKALRRHTVAHFMPHPETGAPIPRKRNYLSLGGDESIISLDPPPGDKENEQILGFVLAGESRMSRESLVERFSLLSAATDKSLVPNLVVTLDGCFVRWGKIGKGERKEVRKSPDGTYGVSVYKDGQEGWQSSWSAAMATHVGGSEEAETFRLLVRWVRQAVEQGRTSHIGSFDRYLEAKSTSEMGTVYCLPKLKPSDFARSPRDRLG
ncbi:MAG: hypothetical protein OXG58_04430 [Gemmatimonadetes bacterium]|nr:hypothetical protein [Gemmatimonadota bacterium]MCY3943174.1 hypothetical protein [Gemmatimonadota bacterium]